MAGERMKTFGKNAADIKKANRGKVLELIATGRCHTRRDLVRYMGLTKMAISNIVTEFQEKRLLVEEDKRPNQGAGRRSAVLAISPDAPKVIGLLVIRACVEVVLCDCTLNVLFRKKVSLHQEQISDRTLLKIIFDLVEEALAHDDNVFGIGVSCLGPVDSMNGVILEPPYFYDIKNIPIVRLLEARFQLPVRINQDNESGALEESLYGNGRDHENMMLVGLERGVGCGIIRDGQLYDGFRQLKPEIGHVSVDFKGRRCVCGNRGCMEMYVNTEELMQRFEKETGKHLSLAEYFDLTRSGEPAMDAIMDDVMEKLSAGISSTINLFNIDLVILGYDGVLLPERYLNLLERKINGRIFYSRIMRVIVKKPYYGQDAQLLGGACNILQALFEGALLSD